MKNPEKYTQYLKEAAQAVPCLINALTEHYHGKLKSLEQYDGMLRRLMEGLNLAEAMLQSRATDRLALTLLIGYGSEIRDRVNNHHCGNLADDASTAAMHALAAIDGY